MSRKASTKPYFIIEEPVFSEPLKVPRVPKARIPKPQPQEVKPEPTPQPQEVEVKPEPTPKVPKATVKDLVAFVGSFVQDHQNDKDLATAWKSKEPEFIEIATRVPKPRAKRDPNAPKGARSAFLFFSKENWALTRQRMIQVNGKIPQFGEVSKAVGLDWKNLVDKTKYQELAKEDKVRAQSEKAAYTPVTPPVTPPVQDTPVVTQPTWEIFQAPQEGNQPTCKAFQGTKQDFLDLIFPERKAARESQSQPQPESESEEEQDSEEEESESEDDRDPDFQPESESESESDSDSDVRLYAKKDRPKEPTTPKRARTAYMFFCLKKRCLADKILQSTGSHSDLVSQAIVLGRMWQKVKEDPKKLRKYLELEAEDKERVRLGKILYTRIIAQY